jgi:uncharacterized Tic20 family protein
VPSDAAAGADSGAAAVLLFRRRTMSQGNVQQPQPVPPVGQSPVDPPEARTWAMLCHLGALAGFIGIPLGNIIGPLIFWLIKKEQFDMVKDQGKESLNFQITMIIAAIISVVLCLVLIGFILIFAVLIFDLIMVIIAAIKANGGVRYRYPLCIRLIK